MAKLLFDLPIERHEFFTVLALAADKGISVSELLLQIVRAYASLSDPVSRPLLSALQAALYLNVGTDWLIEHVLDKGLIPITFIEGQYYMRKKDIQNYRRVSKAV